MLENNNLSICKKMAWRELMFHKGRFFLLVSSVVLVTGLYLFAFLTGNGIEENTLYNFKMQFGSMSDIIYTELSQEQAGQIREHTEIKTAVSYQRLGNLSDTSTAPRNIVLGIEDKDYARSIQAAPMTGRMPKAANEIAMDELTLDSLEVLPEIGSKVRISWRSFADGKEYFDEFVLCGYWRTGMEIQESVAWIANDFFTEKAAEGKVLNKPFLTLGVTLLQQKDAESKAQKILTESLMEGITYRVNLACDPVRIQRAKEEGGSFYTTILFILACGIMLIYGIIHISVESDIRFYGRLKAFGMTPRQVQGIIAGQVFIICIPGILAGFILGILLYLIEFPYLISTDLSLKLQFLTWWPFLVTAVVTFLTTSFACWIPAKRARKASCAQAIQFVSLSFVKKRKKRRTTLLKLAFDKMKNNPGRLLLSVVTTSGAMLLMCSTYIRYISYDEDIYLKSISFCDYYIADASAGSQTQSYNPHSKTITNDFIDTLLEQDGILDYGIIKTQEVEIPASSDTYNEVITFYENTGNEGVPRKDEMAYFPDWTAAYELFKQTSISTSVVIGMDGITFSKAVSDAAIVSGYYDAQKFAAGEYVIAVAVKSGEDSSNSPVGEKVAISGRTYTVMAQTDIPSRFIPGLDSKNASINLNYILPMQEFTACFPNANIRTMMLDVKKENQQKMEAFLSKYKEEHKSRFVITMRSEIQKQFQQSVLAELGVNFVVAFILVFIGILSYVYLLISKTIVRKREFALYESLGMSRRQLRKLLMLEGILYMLFMFIILLCIVFTITWFGMPIYYEFAREWAYTYDYSLMPLWIAIFLFAVLSLAVPNICLWVLEKESITERLKFL